MTSKQITLVVVGTIATIFGIAQTLQAFGVFGATNINPQSRILFSVAFALIGLCLGVTCFKYAFARPAKPDVEPSDAPDKNTPQ